MFPPLCSPLPGALCPLRVLFCLCFYPLTPLHLRGRAARLGRPYNMSYFGLLESRLVAATTSFYRLRTIFSHESLITFFWVLSATLSSDGIAPPAFVEGACNLLSPESADSRPLRKPPSSQQFDPPPLFLVRGIAPFWHPPRNSLLFLLGRRIKVRNVRPFK